MGKPPPLRSAALRAAVAALLAMSAAHGQTIELASVARGGGGFAIRGDGEPASLLGENLAAAGDVNGDGLVDLIVGGPRCGGVNTCQSLPTYVVFGKLDGELVDTSRIQSGVGGFMIWGIEEDDGTGSSIAGPGDVNGDGLADIVIAAPAASPEGKSDAGETYVVFGKPGGERVELADVQAGAGGFAIRGSAAGDSSGWSVSGAGDVNGDGLADVLVASGLHASRYPSVSGATYVVFGRPAATPPTFRRGAARGERNVDISDAIRILAFLFTGTVTDLPCPDAADADDSGALDLTDAVRVLAYLFAGDDAPPAPGPSSCGTDLTPDALGCAQPPRDCGR